jgi:ribosomal protein L7/L12
MNYYAEAIGILKQRTDDSGNRRILIEIAKKNPAAIVNAAMRLGMVEKKEDSWKAGARVMIKNDRLIDAIKHYREHTGLSLQSAKIECDKLKSEMKGEK